MLTSKKLICSWSGGKDSCYALMKAIAHGYQPVALLNMLNEQGQISRSHGIPEAILQAQAEAIGLPLHTVASSWQQYEANFTEALIRLKSLYHAEAVVFGDIDLQAHRDWEEKVCANAALEALLPLWQLNRRVLVHQMLEDGIHTMIVSCAPAMGPAYLGKSLTMELAEDLASKGIDPCGENGEFHTLVTDCALFSHALNVQVTNTLEHQGYWFAQLQMATDK